MTSVVLDVCAASEEWFINSLEDMASRKGVVFVFTNHEKYLNELRGVPKLLTFLNLMGQKGRRVDLPASDCDEILTVLERNRIWLSTNSCDDPHIFAMIYAKSAQFILTKDKRMAKCRKCLSGSVDKRFCAFKAISSEKIYKKFRPKIFKAM